MIEHCDAPAHRPQELLGQAYTSLPETLRAVLDVVPCYRRLTEDWAQQPEGPLLARQRRRRAQPFPMPEFSVPELTWAYRLHMYNFRLWHVEDSVRRPGAADHVIAQS